MGSTATQRWPKLSPVNTTAFAHEPDNRKRISSATGKASKVLKQSFELQRGITHGMFPVQHAHYNTVLNILGAEYTSLPHTICIRTHVSKRGCAENLTQLFSRKRLYDRYQMFGDPMPQQCLP